MALTAKRALPIVITIMASFWLTSCGVKGSPYTPKGRQDSYPRIYPPPPKDTFIPNSPLRKDTDKE